MTLTESGTPKQPPQQIEMLLAELILGSYVRPMASYQIRDPECLPSHLQRIIERAVKEGRVWACWGTAHDIWLFTCELSYPLSRAHGTPVLLVNRYGELGDLTDAGSWTKREDGTWQRGFD